MKDLLLCVHVVVKTANLEISRCHLADYVKELNKSACRTCSTIIFPYSTNQIIVFWRRCCCCRRPCFSFLFTPTTRGFTLKQMKLSFPPPSQSIARLPLAVMISLPSISTPWQSETPWTLVSCQQNNTSPRTRFLTPKLPDT